MQRVVLVGHPTQQTSLPHSVFNTYPMDVKVKVGGKLQLSTEMVSSLGGGDECSGLMLCEEDVDSVKE